MIPHCARVNLQGSWVRLHSSIVNLNCFRLALYGSRMCHTDSGWFYFACCELPWLWGETPYLQDEPSWSMVSLLNSKRSPLSKVNIHHSRGTFLGSRRNKMDVGWALLQYISSVCLYSRWASKAPDQFKSVTPVLASAAPKVSHQSSRMSINSGRTSIRSSLVFSKICSTALG